MRMSNLENYCRIYLSLLAGGSLDLTFKITLKAVCYHFVGELRLSSYYFLRGLLALYWLTLAISSSGVMGLEI